MSSPGSQRAGEPVTTIAAKTRVRVVANADDLDQNHSGKLGTVVRTEHPARGRLNILVRLDDQAGSFWFSADELEVAAPS